MAQELEVRLAEFLAKAESKERLGLHGTLPGIGTLRGEFFQDAEVPAGSLRWELIAFSLYLSHKETHWGTWIGPSLSAESESGERVDSPSLPSITKDCLDYWQQRMSLSTHPLMRARYADAVWELSGPAIGAAPPIEAARIAIDGYIDAVINDRIEPRGWHKEVVQRAINLALSIGDTARLRKIVDDLVSYAADGQDQKVIEWRERDLFHLLTSLSKKHWFRDVLDKLAERISSRIATVGEGIGKQWSSHILSVPLAEYYWKTDRRELAQSVIHTHGNIVRQEAATAHPMMATGWLEQLFGVLQRFDAH